MEHIKAFKAAISAIFAALSALWGWVGWLFWAWILLMAIDVFTGMAAAAKEGEWSSEEARRGIFLHKGGSFLVAIAAGILDLVFGLIIAESGLVLPFEIIAFLFPMVLVWYILTESGSIVENADKLGAPVPQWLKKMIAAFKKKVDDRAEISE